HREAPDGEGPETLPTANPRGVPSFDWTVVAMVRSCQRDSTRSDLRALASRRPRVSSVFACSIGRARAFCLLYDSAAKRARAFAALTVSQRQMDLAAFRN